MDVNVSGDAAGGWVVDVHDGVNHGTYSPVAIDAADAEATARAMHAADFGPAANSEVAPISAEHESRFKALEDRVTELATNIAGHAADVADLEEAIEGRISELLEKARAWGSHAQTKAGLEAMGYDTSGSQGGALTEQPQPGAMTAGAATVEIETRHYSDGTSATGTAPLPALSPDQQAAAAATDPAPTPPTT